MSEQPKTNSTEADEIATIKKLFRQRLIEALQEGAPKASMLAVIGRYLDETGALKPQQPTSQARQAAASTKLPFPRATAPEAAPAKEWERFNFQPPEAPKG